MNPISIYLAWNHAEKCEQCFIRHLVLFADIQRDGFNHLHIPIHDIEIEAGDSLYKEKETAQFVYTIRSCMENS